MRDAARRFFQDDNGRYVIVQWPNAPAWLVFASLVLTRMNVGSQWHRLFEHTTFGAIFLWSYLELTQGESPFRRVVGAGVMAWLLGTTATRA